MPRWPFSVAMEHDRGSRSALSVPMGGSPRRGFSVSEDLQEVFGPGRLPGERPIRHGATNARGSPPRQSRGSARPTRVGRASSRCVAHGRRSRLQVWHWLATRHVRCSRPTVRGSGWVSWPAGCSRMWWLGPRILGTPTHSGNTRPVGTAHSVGPLAAFDGLRRMSTALGTRGVQSMIAAGLMSEQMVRAGLDQRWDPPPRGELAPMAARLARRPGLAAAMIPMLLRGVSSPGAWVSGTHGSATRSSCADGRIAWSACWARCRPERSPRFVHRAHQHRRVSSSSSIPSTSATCIGRPASDQPQTGDRT